MASYLNVCQQVSNEKSMKKPAHALTLAFAFLLFAMTTLPFEEANANPINVYTVPDIQISYPLTSTGGYVNSTVEFEVYIYLPIDSEKLDSVSYSLEGQAAVNVEDLKVKNVNEPVYNGSKVEKVDFKKYTAQITLENLSEGTHTLEAQSGNLTDTQSFTVNSHYIIAELKTLSPTGLFYFTSTVPLTFNVNGPIQDAHYYLYQNSVLISEKALNGNITLDLADGNYDLLLFATTEHGQTSEKIQFIVLSNNYLLLFATAVLAICIALGAVFVIKRKKEMLKPKN
jgi:hypothetical protein